jgi:DNA modification methylase
MTPVLAEVVKNTRNAVGDRQLKAMDVTTVSQVREIVSNWIFHVLQDIEEDIALGLPEIDDRYSIWRVAILSRSKRGLSLGEVKVDFDGKICGHTGLALIRKRLQGIGDFPVEYGTKTNGLIYPAPIPNKVILGDAAVVLEEFPPDTAQLVITSPPYFNAKPEYTEFVDYREYLDFLRRVFVRVHTVLSEGRFFVINVSPVLVRRTSRSTSSKRIPIPFDVHRVLDEIGFDFIDDIIWVKPEGAGWNVGRGRRFAADRQPLQYKPVPVTEYVLVYRKRTKRLIDWNIRNHYNQKLVEQSKIPEGYDVTNVWNIPPGHHRYHPAVFPNELIKKLIRYYSFEDDLVLDPFAGSGTVGCVALTLNRRFLMIDNEPKYFQLMKIELTKYMIGKRVDFEINEEYRREYAS